MKNVKTDKVYKELLNPPIIWMVFIFIMYFSIAVAIWGAFEMVQAEVTMAALLATLPYLWIKLRMVITIDQSELRVDRAHIELKYLKSPVTLDEASYKALRTVNSDARAFHITRPWLKTGVQVSVNDDRDQTSYWLIGSKKTEKLISFLKT